MNDEELLVEFQQLGLGAEDFLAVLLLPMVQVAWADNELQAAERKMILDTSRAMSLTDDGRAAVERWLANDPGTETAQRGHRVLRELARRQQVSLKDMDGVVALSENVAKAAGGLFGVAFTVDQREKEVLREIAGNLSAASIDFNSGNWDDVLDLD